jgi:predicted AAA+ superfamily ATPase
MLPNKRTPSTVSAMQVGIHAAIEALAQPTPAQTAFMNGAGGGAKSSSLKVFIFELIKEA